jgi:hypothetical protein
MHRSGFFRAGLSWQQKKYSQNFLDLFKHPLLGYASLVQDGPTAPQTIVAAKSLPKKTISAN